MTNYLSFVQLFSNICDNHPNITTFSHGDIEDIDKAKQTLFPLAHLVVNYSTISPSSITYNINFIVADKVADVAKDSTLSINRLERDWKGVDDTVWAINTAQDTVSDIYAYLNVNSNVWNYSIDTDVVVTPFKERFTNLLAGVSATFNITTPYNPNGCLFSLTDIQLNGGVNLC